MLHACPALWMQFPDLAFSLALSVVFLLCTGDPGMPQEWKWKHTMSLKKSPLSSQRHASMQAWADRALYSRQLSR